MNDGPLIDARSLAEHLRDPRWVIVDCRFSLLDPPAGKAAYDRGHIPGARYADLDRDLAQTPGPADGRHPLPDRAAFAKRLGEWGIGNGSTVVAYDDAGGQIAARLWWLLRWVGHGAAAVLDGGLAAWQGAGLPTETAAPKWAKTRFEPRPALVPPFVTADELLALRDAGAVILDARAGARYRGEQEPIDPVAGHVPGALSRPTAENLGADGKFRPAGDLRRELDALRRERPASDVIVMCGSGVTACHTLLALEAAGLPGARLYAGSWSEWIRNPARPIATGPSP